MSTYDVDDFLTAAAATDWWITRVGQPLVRENGRTTSYAGITGPLYDFVWSNYVRPRTLRSSSSRDLGTRVDDELEHVTAMGKRRRDGDGDSARRRKRRCVEASRASPTRSTRDIAIGEPLTALGVSAPRSGRHNARPPKHFHDFAHAVVAYCEVNHIELLDAQVCVRDVPARIITFIDLIARRVEDGAILGIELKTGYDAGVDAPTHVSMRRPFRTVLNTKLNQFFFQMSTAAELARREFGYEFDELWIWRVNRTPTSVAMLQLRKIAQGNRSRDHRGRRVRYKKNIYAAPISTVKASEHAHVAYVHTHRIPKLMERHGPALVDHLVRNVEARRRSRRRPTRVAGALDAT